MSSAPQWGAAAGAAGQLTIVHRRSVCSFFANCINQVVCGCTFSVFLLFFCSPPPTQGTKRTSTTQSNHFESESHPEPLWNEVKLKTRPGIAWIFSPYISLHSSGCIKNPHSSGSQGWGKVGPFPDLRMEEGGPDPTPVPLDPYGPQKPTTLHNGDWNHKWCWLGLIRTPTLPGNHHQVIQFRDRMSTPDFEVRNLLTWFLLRTMSEPCCSRGCSHSYCSAVGQRVSLWARSESEENQSVHV